MGCSSSTERPAPAQPAPAAAPAPAPAASRAPAPAPMPIFAGPDLNAIPPEFPPAPQLLPFVAGGSENEYKAYMASKFKYEKWENGLLLYQMRQKDGNTDACNAILERLRAELSA